MICWNHGKRYIKRVSTLWKYTQLNNLVVYWDVNHPTLISESIPFV